MSPPRRRSFRARLVETKRRSDAPLISEFRQLRLRGPERALRGDIARARRARRRRRRESAARALGRDAPTAATRTRNRRPFGGKCALPLSSGERRAESGERPTCVVKQNTHKTAMRLRGERTGSSPNCPLNDGHAICVSLSTRNSVVSSPIWPIESSNALEHGPWLSRTQVDRLKPEDLSTTHSQNFNGIPYRGLSLGLSQKGPSQLPTDLELALVGVVDGELVCKIYTIDEVAELLRTRADSPPVGEPAAEPAEPDPNE